MDLRMGGARPFVPPFPNDSAVLDDHATHRRVRPCLSNSFARQDKRPPHHLFVKIGHKNFMLSHEVLEEKQ
jgi:hypothetical protein